MGSSTKYVLLGLLKIILIVGLAIGLFVIGTMIGYGTLGRGDAKAVFEPETWTHITDFLKK